ncbi:MAG: hypothetical protein V2A73_15755 [Pseudomonadota bacterium]
MRIVSPVGIFDCVGARDESVEAQLRVLLPPEAASRIHALVTTPHPRDGECLVHRDGFCLQG